MSTSTPTQSILVIDDEPHLCAIVKTCLETLGNWHVTTALSAEAGLRQATNAPPDAILLDLLLPDMDGLTLLNQLRHQPQTQSIPVIVLTATSPQTKTLQTLSTQGVAGVIAKPFNPLTLADEVSQQLGWS